MMVFITPHRGVTCSRARDLDGQAALQTVGAVGAGPLPYINTAAGKERVPSPWQDFLIYLGFAECAALNGQSVNSSYLVFFSFYE